MKMPPSPRIKGIENRTVGIVERLNVDYGAKFESVSKAQSYDFLL